MKRNRLVDSDCSFPDLTAKPWWRRRFFKATVVTIVCITGFYFIERQLGERAWRSYQREAAAKGIKLRLADYETPEISDEENFAAVPIFRDVFVSPNHADSIGKQLDLPPWPRQNRGVPKLKDLVDWQQRFVAAGWLPSASANPASDVLRAMEQMEKVLSEVRLACVRPKTRWPVDWSQFSEKPAPMLIPLMRAERALALRARAYMALDQPEAALVEIRNIHRLAESLNGLPLDEIGKCRILMQDDALQIAEEGLQKNRWTPANRKVLLKLLGQNNELAMWRESISGQRCWLNDFVDQVMPFESERFPRVVGEMYGFGRSSFDGLLRFAPRGWIRRAQVDFNRHVDAKLDRISRDGGRMLPEIGDEESKSMVRTIVEAGPARRLASLLKIYVFETTRSIAVEVRARQFLILCTLVDFHEANGEFPADLNQLEPDFLAAIPNDMVDGQTMRYRRLADGGCQLWSIGSDGVDNGGKTSDASPRFFEADWVRQLPPLKNSKAN